MFSEIYTLVPSRVSLYSQHLNVSVSLNEVLWASYLPQPLSRIRYMWEGEVGCKVVRYGDNEVCRNHVTKAPKLQSLTL